jgi:GNAT superfamily N-acetyltransferase
MEQKPEATVTIRAYEDGDHERLRWLFARTPPWGRTYPRPQPLPQELEEMAAHFALRLVATERDIAGEAIVGFAAIGPFVPGEADLPGFVHTDGAARLRWMSVAPERWRLGIGARLLNAAVEWARSEGFGAVVLDTTVEQRGAIALYQAGGFKEIGQSMLDDLWHVVWLRPELR